MTAASASITAFREAMMSADILDQDDFGDYSARLLRYRIMWAFYENTAYRALHRWAQKYKADYGLYKYTRSIYNPANRLGTFWQTHLMGGHLSTKPDDNDSAIPIQTDSEQLLRSIQRLWDDSQWVVNKDIFSLYGVVMGDVGLRAIDDPAAKKVRMAVVHPGTIVDLVKNADGDTTYYRIEETREDPRGGSRDVVYAEIAEIVNGAVHYTTLLDNSLFEWNGVAAEWDVASPFIPFRLVQHNNVGLSWGWSELHAAMSKFREGDDLASKLSDQIRKSVDSPWFFAGVNKPTTTPRTAGDASTAQKPDPGREEIPAIYASNPAARAQAMVGPLDIPGAMQHLSGLLGIIEDEYPELRAERLRLNGDVSARALRLAQQPAEAKIKMRRAHYDAGLARVQAMAVCMGGQLGYAGYEGFNYGSFETEAKHAIADRAVFNVTKFDKLDEEKMFWETAQIAAAAGMPLDLYLESAGWPAERVEKLRASQQFKNLTFTDFP